MNANADIICFAKDWHEPKTSNNHVMEELAKRHRVLWVNSIATRSPNLASGNDLRKIVRKIRSWFRGVEIVGPNLRVLTPVVLPLPGSSLAQKLNRRLVRWLVRRTARRWGMSRPQLWIFPPNAVDHVGQFDESLVVYYCVDEWSEFTHLDAAFIRRKEEELLRRANVVFVVSKKLLETKRPLNPRTHLVPHGVSHDLFARALETGFETAEEVRGLPRPVVGFYGGIYDWIDQSLLAEMARLRPAWSFVLLGKIMTDVSALRRFANIHLLGPRRHDELPRFCKGFDVGIIPYNMNDPRMQSVNPLKLREYLSAGLPVVTVDLPEARNLSRDVRIARGAEEFVRCIEDAFRVNSPETKRARSEQMRSDSWSARVAMIEQLLATEAPHEGNVRGVGVTAA